MIYIYIKKKLSSPYLLVYKKTNFVNQSLQDWFTRITDTRHGSVDWASWGQLSFWKSKIHLPTNWEGLNLTHCDKVREDEIYYMTIIVYKATEAYLRWIMLLFFLLGASCTTVLSEWEYGCALTGRMCSDMVVTISISQ